LNFIFPSRCGIAYRGKCQRLQHLLPGRQAVLTHIVGATVKTKLGLRQK
jgi:hypothetical protein